MPGLYEPPSPYYMPEYKHLISMGIHAFEEGFMANSFKSTIKLQLRGSNTPVEFPTVDHAFQYLKLDYFGDEVKKNLITKMHCLKDVWYLGSCCERYQEYQWIDVKWSMMERCLVYKFDNDDELSCKLMATGNKYLAYAVCEIDWGTGLKMNDADSLNCNKWTGRNWLGRLLMMIREAHQKWMENEFMVHVSDTDD